MNFVFAEAAHLYYKKLRSGILPGINNKKNKKIQILKLRVNLRNIIVDCKFKFFLLEFV